MEPEEEPSVAAVREVCEEVRTRERSTAWACPVIGPVTSVNMPMVIERRHVTACASSSKEAIGLCHGNVYQAPLYAGSGLTVVTVSNYIRQPCDFPWISSNIASLNLGQKIRNQIVHQP